MKTFISISCIVIALCSSFALAKQPQQEVGSSAGSHKWLVVKAADDQLYAFEWECHWFTDHVFRTAEQRALLPTSYRPYPLYFQVNEYGTLRTIPFDMLKRITQFPYEKEDAKRVTFRPDFLVELTDGTTFPRNAFNVSCDEPFGEKGHNDYVVFDMSLVREAWLADAPPKNSKVNAPRILTREENAKLEEANRARADALAFLKKAPPREQMTCRATTRPRSNEYPEDLQYQCSLIKNTLVRLDELKKAGWNYGPPTKTENIRDAGTRTQTYVTGVEPGKIISQPQVVRGIGGPLIVDTPVGYQDPKLIKHTEVVHDTYKTYTYEYFVEKRK